MRTQMTITLIEDKAIYDRLLEIQQKCPALTYQQKGFDGIDRSKFSQEDKDYDKEVNTILGKHIHGFVEFQNFCHNAKGELRIRFQYQYEGGIAFTGVGYLFPDELLNGFRDKAK